MPNHFSNADPIHNSAPPPKGHVICCGFLTYCMLIVVEEFPVQNGGATIQNVVDSLGDDAAIVAVTLGRWQVPSTLVSSPISNDFYGSKVLEQLSASGISFDQKTNQEATTPLEVGVVDGTGSRTYFQERDPRILALLAVPSHSQMAEASMLYVDWYDGPRVLDAMERAQAHGVLVFLNLESKYSDRSKLSDLLRFVDVCQVSVDEPQASGNPPDIARDLLAAGVGTVLVTLGAKGCLVAQNSQAFRISPPQVKVIDGYGAGAAFSAGAIYGILAGWSLEQTGRFASACSGIKCGVAGNAVLPIDMVLKTAALLPCQPLSLGSA